MCEMVVGSLIKVYQKSNAEQVNDEFDGLMAQAEDIFNNADEVLAKFENAVMA